MDAPVRRQLGMKCRRERGPLADSDDPTRARLGTENLDASGGFLDPGRPDEDRAEGRAGDAAQRYVALERVHLPAERVPPDADIEAAERLLAAGPETPGGLDISVRRNAF